MLYDPVLADLGRYLDSLDEDEIICDYYLPKAEQMVEAEGTPRNSPRFGFQSRNLARLLRKEDLAAQHYDRYGSREDYDGY